MEHTPTKANRLVAASAQAGAVRTKMKKVGDFPTTISANVRTNGTRPKPQVNSSPKSAVIANSQTFNSKVRSSVLRGNTPKIFIVNYGVRVFV